MPRRVIRWAGMRVRGAPSKVMAPVVATWPAMAREQGGLAGAVRADDGDDFAGLDLEADALEGR